MVIKWRCEKGEYGILVIGEKEVDDNLYRAVVCVPDCEVLNYSNPDIMWEHIYKITQCFDQIVKIY